MNNKVTAFVFTIFVFSSVAFAQEPVRVTYPVISNAEIVVYGRIQLDVIFDDSVSYPGPYALYGISEEGVGNTDDNQFYITANSTRLGMMLMGPEMGARRLTGLVEVDFQGDPENNNPDLLLRHAYLKYNWGNGWEIIAGQTWDVIAPLQPELLNWAPAWGWGNIGFWHPQLRISHWGNLVDAQFAISNPNEGDFDGGGIDDGEDAGYPNFQGRVGLHFENDAAFGLYGHYGEQEIDTRPGGGNERYVDTWSGGIDVAFPVTGWFFFTGEMFFGSNLDGYMGGILQGIQSYRKQGRIERDGYQSLGAWLNFALGKEGGKVRSNLGGSFDDIPDWKLEHGERTQNMVFWSNIFYEFYPSLTVGFEFWHMETLYWRVKKGEPNRWQLSLMYEF